MSQFVSQAKDQYEAKKRALVEDFKKNLENKKPFSLKKNASNLFRDRKANQSNKLDVKQLNQVISIDRENLVAEVEGMITFEDLCSATLKHGCLPPVVPELKTITVGGALVGLGIEATSFRYGLVHETILEVEVLTGDGSVIVCRPDNENSDLFYALPNSFGTFGYALKIKMQLIEAKPFMRLTNLHFNEINAYFDKLKELCSTKTQGTYIDGAIFNQNEMAIVIGEFVDEAPYLSDYTYMNIYYESIRQRDVNYLTTEDYIWRWDPDWFWCSKHFGMQYKALRLLFGKFMLGSVMYWKINRFVAKNPVCKFLFKLFEKPSESVIQDILIPVDKAPDFFHFLDSSIEIKPIWICPFRLYRDQHPYPLFKVDSETLYIDFGFWDVIQSDKPKGFYNRLIERKTDELSGFKSLYSSSYYTEEEFWQIYPKADIAHLKDRYDPKRVFKDLYQKCVLGE